MWRCCDSWGAPAVSGLEIRPIAGLPEIEPGMELGAAILEATAASGETLRDGDILVVTQKIVSKAEGCHRRWRANGPTVGPRTRASSSWCCAKAAASCAWTTA